MKLSHLHKMAKLICDSYNPLSFKKHDKQKKICIFLFHSPNPSASTEATDSSVEPKSKINLTPLPSWEPSKNFSINPSSKNSFKTLEKTAFKINPKSKKSTQTNCKTLSNGKNNKSQLKFYKSSKHKQLWSLIQKISSGENAYLTKLKTLHPLSRNSNKKSLKKDTNCMNLKTDWTKTQKTSR